MPTEPCRIECIVKTKLHLFTWNQWFAGNYEGSLRTKICCLFSQLLSMLLGLLTWALQLVLSWGPSTKFLAACSLTSGTFCCACMDWFAESIYWQIACADQFVHAQQNCVGMQATILTKTCSYVYLTLSEADQKWISVKLSYHCIETSGSPTWIGHGWRELSAGEVSGMLITHWNKLPRHFLFLLYLDCWLNGWSQ